MSSSDSRRARRDSVFALGQGLSQADVLASIGARFTVRALAPRERHLLWLDTPDWRLQRAGAELRALGRGPVRELELHPGRGEPCARLAVEGALDFSWDLPEGELRELLEPLARARRLLPQVELTTHEEGLEVLDGGEEPVASVVLESSRARSGEQGEVHDLGSLLRVRALRGIEGARDALSGFLETELGLARVAEGDLERALSATGRNPHAEVPDWRVDLCADEPAGLAVRRVLGRFLEIMAASEVGLLADVDSEYLHDFRVAVRRSRSILGQAKSVLPKSVCEHAAVELAWLGDLTTWMRDLDVFVLQIRERVRAGDALWSRLDAIRGRVEAARASELARVREGLESARWREFRAAWSAELGAKPGSDEPAPAALPVIELAAARIARLHRKVLKAARKLAADAPAEDFHALRIQCKKLRYMTDAFGGLFSEKGVRRLVRRLKRLQGLLGEFNDGQVQQDTLRRVAGGLEGADPEALLAMGRLVERFAARSRELRPEILERLARFAASEDRERVERLLALPRVRRGPGL